MVSFKNFYLIIQKLKFDKFFLFFFLVCLISALLEVISIGSILPLISLVSNEGLIKTYPKIYNLLIFFSPLNLFELDISDEVKVIVSVCFLTFLIFLFRFFFQIFTDWVKASFIYNLEYSMANKLFKNVMYAPYEFHLKSNSSDFHRDIQNNIGYFSATANAITVLMIEILIIIGLIILALKINFFATVIIIFFLTSFGLLFLNITKKVNFSLGKDVHESSQSRVKNLIEGLGGIKEILIFNKLETFISQFKKSNSRLTNAKKKNTVIGNLPRFIVEFLLITVLLFALVIITFTANSISGNLTIIGFFVATFIRVTPSAYRIISSLQRVKFTQKILQSLRKNIFFFDELARNNQSPKLKVKKNNLIEIRDKIKINNLNFSYDPSRNIFSDLNLEIKVGDTIGIFGDSGSGKSTFVNLLIGMLEPKSGEILINNKNISSNLENWKSNIGYVPQNIFLMDDTFKKNISFDFEDGLENTERLMYCIRQADLENFINSLPNGLNTVVGERGSRISGGQLQRVGIARALFHDPKILIFDESTSALDNETELEIMKNIYSFKNKKTLIIVTHKKELLKVCDKIYKLENGTFKVDEK